MEAMHLISIAQESCKNKYYIQPEFGQHVHLELSLQLTMRPTSRNTPGSYHFQVLIENIIPAENMGYRLFDSL